MEFVDLGMQFQQKQGEPFSVWLVRPWDTGVDGILCQYLRRFRFEIRILELLQDAPEIEALGVFGVLGTRV